MINENNLEKFNDLEKWNKAKCLIKQMRGWLLSRNEVVLNSLYVNLDP